MFATPNGLKGLEEEVFLQAEKRNTTVMMRCGYDEKIEMLETSTYGKLLQQHWKTVGIVNLRG